MNIGLFTDCYYPQINGVVTSTMILKDELEKRGHNVTIVTVKIPGFQDDKPGVLRIPSIPFRKWKEFRIGLIYPYSVIKKIKDLNLDIIHTQTEFSVCLMARLIARIMGIPVIHTYHTMYEDYTHYVAKRNINKKIATKLSKVGSKLYLNECASVIAPSEKTKKALIQYGVTNNIEVIPTGIKLDNFKKGIFTTAQLNAKRSEIGLFPDEKVLLYLGRIAEEKSIDVIIKQMPGILEKNSSIRLAIVGDGPKRKELENLSAQLNIKDKTIFTGRVPWNETGLYYQLADLFVSASKTETQGLTILEAMSAGVPVLVRHDDNIKNFITHGYNGMVFEKDSDVPTAVLKCINDDNLLKNLSNNGLKTAYNLSSEYFGYKVESLYFKCLNQAKKIS